MVTMAQNSKRCELAQHTHSRGSHAFIHTLTSTGNCAKCQLSYYTYRIWNDFFIFKVPERGGSKLKYPEKTPDSLPANWYHILLEEKIQHPGWELNPHPSTVVLKGRPDYK